jgi:methyl-accepting chemotaxis protein
MGTEVSIENRTLGVVARANVVWLSEKHYPGDVHHVGLQLIEAQNVWGIAFPPDDWRSQPREDNLPAAEEPPPAELADALEAETRLSSLAGEEITIRLLQELQESADAHAHDFQERLKDLSHRLGSELEFDLRERAAHARTHEVGALEEEIRVLRESLSTTRKEIAQLEAKVQELQCGLKATPEKPPPSPPLQEAHRQLTALANSVVESMNRAAAAGLREYRSLLQKENQQSAARVGAGTGKNPPLPGGPSPEY